MSERTATRIAAERSSVSGARRAPIAHHGRRRRAAGSRGYAGGHRAARGGDDQAVAGEAGDARRRRPRASRRRARRSPARAAAELGVEVAALPGDEDAARREQREGELDELGGRGDGARGDDRPAPAMARVGGERLGPDGATVDARRRARSPRRRSRRKPAFLPTGSTRAPARAGQGGRERQAREAAAGAEVEEPVDAALAQHGHRRQAVDDVARSRPPPDRGSRSG